MFQITHDSGVYKNNIYGLGDSLVLEHVLNAQGSGSDPQHQNKQKDTNTLGMFFFHNNTGFLTFHLCL